MKISNQRVEEIINFIKLTSGDSSINFIPTRLIRQSTPYHDTLYGWVAFVVKYIMTYSFARSLLAEMFIIKTYTLQRNRIGKGVEPQQSS